MCRAELPGPGAQDSVDEIPDSEEKEHKKNPREFAGDHGDVVVSLVHQLFTTAGDDGGVGLRAADLVVPTEVLAASPEGVNHTN